MLHSMATIEEAAAPSNTASSHTGAQQFPMMVVPKLPAGVAQCMYIDWYQFRECTIKSCKNWTRMTEHRCLAVDRVQPTGNKIISDAELHYYKFSKDGISTKYVSIKRKEAMQRVKALLVLHQFIEWVKAGYIKDSRITFDDKKLVARESCYPLKLKRLGFENWMWQYLAAPKMFRLFSKGKVGELNEIHHHDVLSVTPAKFQTLCSIVKEITKCKVLRQTVR